VQGAVGAIVLPVGMWFRDDLAHLKAGTRWWRMAARLAPRGVAAIYPITIASPSFGMPSLCRVPAEQGALDDPAGARGL